MVGLGSPRQEHDMKLTNMQEAVDIQMVRWRSLLAFEALMEPPHECRTAEVILPPAITSTSGAKRNDKGVSFPLISS